MLGNFCPACIFVELVWDVLEQVAEVALLVDVCNFLRGGAVSLLALYNCGCSLLAAHCVDDILIYIENQSKININPQKCKLFAFQKNIHFDILGFVFYVSLVAIQDLKCRIYKKIVNWLNNAKVFKSIVKLALEILIYNKFLFKLNLS